LGSVYSHSRLAAFENCKRQFYFRYVLEVPAEVESIEAFVGKRVHEVLERLHQFADTGRVPSHDKVLRRYREEFAVRYDPERIRIVREENPLSFYRELGERCLSEYYRRHYPFDRDETLGLEQRVVFDLDAEGRYRLQGIIDRVVRAKDGTIEIHDYKTGRWVPSQKRLDQDRQLALYQIGLQEQYGPDQPMRLVWHYLQRGQRRTSTRTPEDLDQLRSDTIGLIDRIHAEREFAPSRIPLCDWCEYRSICPAWNPDAPPPAPRSRRRSTPAPDPDQLELL